MVPLRASARLKADRVKSMQDYRNGAEGFILWCEDKVRIPIYPPGSDIPEYHSMGKLPDSPHPDTGRSYKTIWDGQKKMIRKALVMNQGKFVYRLIILCWMRGEGKSLLACLIQLWKFFCWPRQQIMLGANSKDQVKFVHYDIMRDIVINSPQLLSVVGKRNIQEKEIRLKDSSGNIRSIIRSISSFSGIVSNITGFTFSEIFEMKNPKFFVQLYGSIRNIPNAIGVIDSTVSSKQHILYQQYQNWLTGKSGGLFFDYRYSKSGDHRDYWNPMMTQSQLEDYRASFPFGEFERYFLNLWEAGHMQIFSDEMVEEMGYMGIDGELLNHTDVIENVNKKNELIKRLSIATKKEWDDGVRETEDLITGIDHRIIPVTNYYSLHDNFGFHRPVSMESLANIGRVLDTDWLILAGADMGDPMALRGNARSIFTCVAKGLPGSKSNPHVVSMETAVLKFVYIVLHIFNIENHAVNTLKEQADMCNDEYDGIDVFCGERYGLWDMQEWCKDRDIEFIPIFPNYARQKEAFKEFYDSLKEGRFKCPDVKIPGSKKEDILREELEKFDHETRIGPTGQESGWFGSPEKLEKYGAQDDSVFSIGWTLYGGKDKGPSDFRVRKSAMSFGVFIENKALMGQY